MVLNDWKKSSLVSINDGNLALMNNSKILMKDKEKNKFNSTN